MDNMKESRTLKREADIQNQILDWLNKNGIFAWRTNSTGIYDDEKKVYRTPSKYSLKGVSDILGILPSGLLLSIEVKSATGRLTMEQKAFLNRVNKFGGLAFMARSLEQVKEIMKEY